MSNGTLYPPLPDCFYTGSNATCDAVSITMLQFLNITNHVTYNQHYCMNPPQDSCEFGYCPNPDVAGFYTRIADYVTNICLALIIFYAPEELVVSFYAQLLSVYSLFVTIVISIINQNLTRLHATIALVAAGSPLSIYMIVYALRTMLWGSTRMDPVYARGHERWWVNRIIVLMIVPCWIGIAIFLSIAGRRGILSQAECDLEERPQLLLVYMFFLPLVPFVFSFAEGMACLSPIVILIVVWIICITIRRTEIWSGHSVFPIRHLWRTVCDQYPFLQFLTVIVFPFTYWILTLEIGVSVEVSDQVNNQATFGQVIAIFVAIPPLWSLLQVLHKLPAWLWDLTWVRALTCRCGKPRNPRPQHGNQTFNVPLVSPHTPSHGSHPAHPPKMASYNSYDSYNYEPPKTPSMPQSGYTPLHDPFEGHHNAYRHYSQ